MDLNLLLVTALSVGVIHTLLDPDHYIPFIAMARARAWSLRKTLVISTLCGIGHVAGSLVLGGLGIGLGWAVGGLESFEAARGQIAGWLLLALGLVYLAWGIRRATRRKPHTHLHAHVNGTVHAHGHTHDGEHAHVHSRPFAPDGSESGASITPWVLFTIFVFGPCEPLIPVLMYPAALGSWWGVAAVATVFAITTVGTMLVVVLLGCYGLARFSYGHMERYSHALAGFALAACGAAVTLGL